MTAQANPAQEDFLVEPDGAIPTLEIVIELERELGIRKKVFPRWIETGKIARAQANRRIAIVERLLSDYTEQLTQEAGPRPF